MKYEYLKYLACPKTGEYLEIKEVYKEKGGRIESGLLTSKISKCVYEIVNFIPRFVPIKNYSTSFGIEWVKHAKTQYDSYSGINESETRFFKETKWPRDLKGELILEVGCGSGRFTEQAASTGAFVVSMDYSHAVEANYSSNGMKDNVLIVQGDIYSMPFRKKLFDKLFCMGVLQHTPDPHKSFMSLPPFLKNNGELVIDIYKKQIASFFTAKQYVRPFTKNMNPYTLYKLTKKYIDFMWHLACIIRKIPKIGPMINWALLIADYSRMGLKGEILKEWAYLDTYDMISPKYDYPQTIKTVRKWFENAGLTNTEVHYGYNGTEGRGTIIWNDFTKDVFFNGRKLARGM